MLKRGKQKIPTHFGMLDLYRNYKATTKDPISYRDFSDLHQSLNDEVLTLIREKNFIYNLPAKLGKFRVKKYKTKVKVNEDGSFEWKSLKIDFKKTWEYWESKYPGKTRQEILKIPNKARVYHDNRHTLGYGYKYVWYKGTSIFKGKSVISFKPVRKHSRALASWLKSVDSAHIDYFE